MIPREVKLTDFIEVRPTGDLASLSRQDKVRLMDSMLNLKDEAKRGLGISFRLSSSARLINYRVYPPRGQQAGVDSWTRPFPKPILVQHRTDGDPLGRINRVVWEPLDNEAIRFFSDYKDFDAFKRQINSGDSKRIYKALADRNLLTNKQWPGIGRLFAHAKITDEKAIEKFLDERYLCFSAGSTTDQYVCGICGEDWALGNICDHAPGTITDEGQLAVFITGVFKGREASVINDPADDLAQLASAEFEDSALSEIMTRALCIDETPEVSFCLTDSFNRNQGDDMPTKLEKAVAAVKGMGARRLADALFEDSLDESHIPALQRDALEGTTHYETQWLIRVHDALHMEYDWRIRYNDDERTPRAVFQLHADLHDLSNTKGFRDSLINGDLDGFDAKGKASDSFKLDNDDAKVVPVPGLLAEDSGMVNRIVDELEKRLGRTEEVRAQPEEETEVDPLDLGDQAEVVWGLLDRAYLVVLGSAAPEADALDALDDEVFCAPGRRLVVSEVAHVEVARQTVADSALPEAARAALLERIDARAQQLEPDVHVALLIDLRRRLSDLEKEDIAKLIDEHLGVDVDKEQQDAVSEDYEQALRMIDKLKSEIDELKSQLDTSERRVDNDNEEEELPPGSVEDPGGSGTPALGHNDKLTDYETMTVERYKQIHAERGEEAAERFIADRKARRYLKPSFNISEHFSPQETD